MKLKKKSQTAGTSLRKHMKTKLELVAAKFYCMQDALHDLHEEVISLMSIQEELRSEAKEIATMLERLLKQQEKVQALKGVKQYG